MNTDVREDNEARLALKLRNLLRRRALEKLYLPRPAPTVFPLHKRFTNLYPFIAETIGVDAPVRYLEFGVFRGASMKCMSRLFRNPEARFIGFDSFEGLPEVWGDKPAGAFSVDGALPVINDTRVSFVKGFFQNTFADFMRDFTRDDPPGSPVLVHFDADLYSSTLFLMTALWQHIPEYYFLFDEFPNDEATAMLDFVSAYPVEYSFIACSSDAARNGIPQQLFGRLKNVALTF